MACEKGRLQIACGSDCVQLTAINSEPRAENDRRDTEAAEKRNEVGAAAGYTDRLVAAAGHADHAGAAAVGSRWVRVRLQGRVVDVVGAVDHACSRGGWVAPIVNPGFRDARVVQQRRVGGPEREDDAAGQRGSRGEGGVAAGASADGASAELLAEGA